MDPKKQEERKKEMYRRVDEFEKLLAEPGMKPRDAISSKLYSMASAAYKWGVQDQKDGAATNA